MKKILVIEDRAKIINFRNRKVRTPVTLTISDSDLKHLMIQMRMADIKQWKVKEIVEDTTEVIDYDFAEPKEVIIEELETPKTTLEKLMKTGECE